MDELADPIGEVVAEMEAAAAGLDDARRHFHETYLRTTLAVADEVRAGGFDDPGWVSHWDAAFARFYLDALAADRRGGDVPGPWRVAFAAAREQPDIPPLLHVLFGMNAHINYDLPQALIAVIPAHDFDEPSVVRGRQRDHQHVDTVLQGRIAAENAELAAISRVTILDRALQPANRAASRRFLREAREKVWHNTRVLDEARRAGGPAYATTLASLEVLCEARVRDLTRPGFVLLKLAARGFGVVLPATPDVPQRPERGHAGDHG